MEKDFGTWLLEEIGKRDWSQSELARKSGLTRQSISDYVNRRRANPDPQALRKIAQALHLSPETVFAAAGLLPEEKDDDPGLSEWIHRYISASPAEREQLIAFARFLTRNK